MAWMSGRSRSTTAAYSSSRIADMPHLFLMVIRNQPAWQMRSAR